MRVFLENSTSLILKGCNNKDKIMILRIIILRISLYLKVVKFLMIVTCLQVRLNKSESEAYHAHIQEVSPNKGPVTVYIVELGKK